MYDAHSISIHISLSCEITYILLPRPMLLSLRVSVWHPFIHRVALSMPSGQETENNLRCASFIISRSWPLRTCYKSESGRPRGGCMEIGEGSVPISTGSSPVRSNASLETASFLLLKLAIRLIDLIVLANPAMSLHLTEFENTMCTHDPFYSYS